MGDHRSTLSESIYVLSPEDSYDVSTNQALYCKFHFCQSSFFYGLWPFYDRKSSGTVNDKGRWTFLFPLWISNFIPKNLKVETSFYDTEFKKSQLDFNFRKNFQNNQSSSCSSVVNHPIEHESMDQLDKPIKGDDFTVEFYSSKPIEQFDLEIILLFLENSKQSGGGDSTEHQLDSSKHLLTIKYESSRAKERRKSKRKYTRFNSTSWSRPSHSTRTHLDLTRRQSY